MLHVHRENSSRWTVIYAKFCLVYITFPSSTNCRPIVINFRNRLGNCRFDMPRNQTMPQKFWSVVRTSLNDFFVPLLGKPLTPCNVNDAFVNSAIPQYNGFFFSLFTFPIVPDYFISYRFSGHIISITTLWHRSQLSKEVAIVKRLVNTFKYIFDCYFSVSFVSILIYATYTCCSDIFNTFINLFPTQKKTTKYSINI